MKTEPIVLAIQDTSYLNFSTHKQTQGLGPIGDRRTNSQGIVTHNILAVTPEGLPLGLFKQTGWTRDGYNQQTRQQRQNTSIEDKESYRWIAGIEDVQKLKPEQTRVVMLCDRECDIYEFFVAAGRTGAEFVIRAAWNRHLQENELPRVWELLQAQPVAGQYQITVASHDSQPQRVATLAVRSATLTLGSPQRPKNALFYPLPAVTLHAVYVTQTEPPDPSGAIEWMLLTNIAVNSFADALEKVDWYCCRWQIEVFHKILPHGCKVEQCRLQSAQRLNRYITLISIVAWRLFWLTYLQRTHPSAPATLILTAMEIQTLLALEGQPRQGQSAHLSVAQAVSAIARLGGFLARKHDGNPGPTVIWRGWSVLQNAARLGSYLRANASY